MLSRALSADTSRSALLTSSKSRSDRARNHPGCAPFFFGAILVAPILRALRIDAKISPADRPLQAAAKGAVIRQLQTALTEGDGLTGAHCIHEMWMRDDLSFNIERALEQLWTHAAASVPEWLPMRFVDWLPRAYEIALDFKAGAKGRSNIYLVLLDFADRREPYGIYVGMSKYSPAQRFDQHKAGIRAAGSVLKRGIEVLSGPTMHLQFIKRSEAARIEQQLAEAFKDAGFHVEGGH
jgi:hypothetical protein